MIRVLVVDDKDDSRELLRVLFESEGWDVALARDGVEALAIARHDLPELLVADLLMLLMDGYGLLREWQADERLKAIPFVVHAATYTDPVEGQIGLNLGTDALVLTPTDPGPFLDRVRGIAAGIAARSDAPPPEREADHAARLRETNEVLVRRLQTKALELERVNRDLILQKARLRAIVDTEPECVKLMTRDNRILEMNPAGLRMLEVDSFEEVANRCVLPHIVEEDRAAFAALTERVFRGEAGIVEFGLMGLKGTRRTLETHSAPLRDATGRITALLAITRDVSGDRAASDALRASEARLQEAQARLQIAVAAGKIGLWDWDLRSDEVVYSTEWKRQIGHADDDLVGGWSEWTDRLHPDDRASTLQAVAAYLAADEPDFTAEFRFLHASGSYRNILARASEIRDEAGQRIRLVGSHVDLTETMELRAQLLQSQKMESLGRLAGGVSHDFNNLLTVIGGFADLALAGVKDEDPLGGHLREIRRASERAEALTRQLLAFSRSQLMKPEIVDATSLVMGMEGMLRRIVGEDLEMVFDLDADAGQIRADAGQVEQVVMNLVANARDSMPNGGRLIISTRGLDLDAEGAAECPGIAPGPHVMLTVTDTGEAMDEAVRARVFEPFFTTKPRGKGTGLGLATVHGIVAQSGGCITVDSKVGRGTSFRVVMPRVQEGMPAQPRTAAPPITSRGRGGTILVVEDEDALRHLVKHVLGLAGFTVLEASSGDAVLALLERHEGSVDLMLTDVVMPGLSGPELAAQLAPLRPSMKVLFTSGYSDDAVLRYGVAELHVAFLAKPYTSAALTEKIREMLD